jgi:uncharacterized protein
VRIGVLSDTHGMLRAEVLERFAGVEHILHAGDVGSAELLTELEALAPVTAVWGNTDGWDVHQRTEEIARLSLAGASVVVLHGHQLGSPTPEALAERFPEADLVVFGHTHRAVAQRVGSGLALNPGSAGPPRFGMRPTLALVEIDAGRVSDRIVGLDPARR